ncbi:unnamed protein product [Paramecium sonneborni]|uniref:Tetratricopeptide repeat protein n=1 Tax=Paramecium sonneborni TaxID=65129 RepID=A0A8S1QVU1_9CILI|nr:unnamed protein product [Paramecium sonneborni]
MQQNLSSDWKNNLFCTIHREECVGFCCLNKNCSENRLCCQKCLQQYHQYHTNEIIILDALEEFISNSSKNVKQVIATSKNRFECVKESIDSLIYKLENKIYGLESSIQKLNTSQLEELIKYSFQYEELEQILKSSFDELTNHIQKTLEGIYLNYSLHDRIQLDEQIIVELGDDLLKQKDYFRAKEYFEQCIQINPKNSTALLGIANCLRENKKYKEAEQYYTKVKLLDESNINIFCGLGECLRQQMQIEKALIQFDEALRIDPSFSQAAFYKGVLLIYQGIWRVLQNGENEELVKEEIFTYFKNITLNDNDTYVRLFKSLFLSLDGYPEDAEQIIEEVVKITPNNYEGLLIKSFMLFGKQQFGLALQLLGQIKIQDLFVAFFKSLCLFNLEQYNEAIKFLDSILESNSNNQNVYLFKGQCLLKLKKPKEALQIFYSILEINPKHKDALECKDQCLEAIEQEKEAISDLEYLFYTLQIKNLMKNLLKYIFKLDIHYFSIIYKTCLFSTSVYQFQQ